jgi:ABC-type cobalamin/Fe3+-siderophores transport system ATPase subunit
MVRLIVGNKGKGKTTEILNRVNTQIKEAKGSIVYLDKSSKHMYELNNKIRLIDVSRFPITNSEQFVGFVCGIISQDHDLQEMYLDGFLKCTKLDEDDIDEINDTIRELDAVSTAFDIDFYISVSVDVDVLVPELREKVVAAL